MSLIITNTGKQKALEYITGKDSSTETLVLKLYSNNVTPSESDTVSSYTELVSSNGYTSKSLSASSWIVTGGTASYSRQTWSFTGAAGNVYGYYLVSATSNELYFAERFPDAPYNVTSAGDSIKVTLNLTLN